LERWKNSVEKPSEGSKPLEDSDPYLNVLILSKIAQPTICGCATSYFSKFGEKGFNHPSIVVLEMFGLTEYRQWFCLSSIPVFG